MTYLPKVSVMMIAYNHMSYVRDAIESVLEQDYPNLELVIADDASTDGTAQVIAEYARRFPNRVIPVLSRSNAGITHNSNRGLGACTGELISFIDSDDLMLPGKISAQVEWFSTDCRRVLCGHQLEVFYEKNTCMPHILNRKLRAGTGAKVFIHEIPFGKSSVMIRATRMPAHLFDEALPIMSDLLMWIEVVREDGEFGFVAGTFGRYRRHDNNVTNAPLLYLEQVECYFEILRARFKCFERVINKAAIRRLYYDVGVMFLRNGQKALARKRLFEALRREPWFVRTWIRLAQTLL